MGGIYELPGGKVGDMLDRALICQVKETGLDIESIANYPGSFDDTSGSGKTTRQFNVTDNVTTTKPVVLQEHDEYRWVPISEEPPVTGAVKKVLARYRELIDGQA